MGCLCRLGGIGVTALRLVWFRWRERWKALQGATKCHLIPHCPSAASNLLVYADGRKQQTGLLAERLFPGGLEPALQEKTLSVRDMLLHGLPTRCAAAFFHSGFLLGMRLRRRGWHLHLRWVDVTIDNRHGTEATIRNASRNVRRNLEGLRAQGWCTELSQDPTDLEQFEVEMYRPTLDARYGSRATRFDGDSLRRMLQEGFLIKALLDGEWFAADLAVLCPQELWLAVSGVRLGDEGVRRSNVFTLLTERALRETERLGIPCLNHGGSLGFADDGTLLYKTRWGGIPKARGYSQRGGRMYARDWFDVAIWVDPHDREILSAVDRALPLVDAGATICGLSGTKARPADFNRLAENFGWKVLGSA